jgi:hypothetical protein
MSEARSESALIPMWIPEGHDPALYGVPISRDQTHIVLPHNALAAREALIIGAVYEERDA